MAKAESGKRRAGKRTPRAKAPTRTPKRTGVKEKPRARVFRRAPGVDARLLALEGLLESPRPRSRLETAGIRRQMLDLEEGHRRGLIWDEEAASRAVAFFSLLKHWKGEWAGEPFRLEPWQDHGVIAPLFGWKRKEDGLRRFRTAYCELPRKNGKTTLAAGIGLQGLIADGEPGAEVYAAATKRDQACILFEDAKQCLGRHLRRLVELFAHSITCKALSSSFKPLSSDYDSLDGLNLHRAIVDELHAHKTRKLWDVLVTSPGTRRQPLIAAITTAGDDETSICGEVRNQLALGVLEGKPDHNDTFFAWISCAETDDDWMDPQTWLKANPNLGVTIKEDYLAEQCRNARVSKASENNFRRKHLDQWITGAAEWISSTNWARCRQAKFPDLSGREVFEAIDIGWRDDFAALGRVFPERIAIDTVESTAPALGTMAEQIAKAGQMPEPRRAQWKVRSAHVEVELWVPSHGKRDIHQPPLVNWIERGLVHVTPGNTTDTDAILAQVQRDVQKYQVREIAIDPNNARQLGNDLEAFGIPRFEFWQSIRNYHEPCMEFATLVANKQIHHDGHEVLAWMIKNVRLKQNSAGYVMPAKDKSPEKIDGPVTLLMAMALAMFSATPSLDYYLTNELEIG